MRKIQHEKRDLKLMAYARSEVENDVQWYVLEI